MSREIIFSSNPAVGFRLSREIQKQGHALRRELLDPLRLRVFDGFLLGLALSGRRFSFQWRGVLGQSVQ